MSELVNLSKTKKFHTGQPMSFTPSHYPQNFQIEFRRQSRLPLDEGRIPTSPKNHFKVNYNMEEKSHQESSLRENMKLSRENSLFSNHSTGKHLDRRQSLQPPKLSTNYRLRYFKKKFCLLSNKSSDTVSK